MNRKLKNSCPQSREVVIQNYFMEHRAKLIDIAAYLDRVDRAEPATAVDGQIDFRQQAFMAAVEILQSSQTDRVRRILTLFSDTSDTIPQSAAGTKGATGAVDITSREDQP